MQRPDDLNSWIKIATSGLPPTVQTRLASEIEDHYASVLEKELGEGQSQTQAEAMALQQLGKANQVAKSYRDAHFSREGYSKAMWAVVGLLVIHIVNSIGWVIGREIENRAEFVYYNDKFVYFDQYFGIWNVITGLLSAVILLVIARGVVMFLKERFDIQITRAVFNLFVVSLFSSTIGMAVYNTLYWFEWYVVRDSQFRVIVESPIWNAIKSVSAAVGGLSPIFIGLSLIVLVLMTWKSIHDGKNVFTYAFAMMTGGVGASMIFNVLFTLNIIPIGLYRINRYYVPIVIPTFLISFTALLVMILMIFRIMGTSGNSLWPNLKD